MPQAKIPDEHVSCVRAAMRAELAAQQELFRAMDAGIREAVRAELEQMISENGPWREVMRIELASAFERSELSRLPETRPRGRSRGPSRGPSGGMDILIEGVDEGAMQVKSEDVQTGPDSAKNRDSPISGTAIDFEDRHRMAVGEHLSRFVSSHSKIDEMEESVFLQWLNLANDSPIMRAIDSWYLWLMNVEEPRREGVLADIITSKVFEMVVCGVIFLNIAFMIYSANHSIQYPRNPSTAMKIGDWVFQILYTIELLLKLMVHRQFFFFNVTWRLNWFDLFLVFSGYVTALADSGVITGTFLRVLRLVKFGKAMRTVRIMAQLKHLRNFLVCLQGSFMNFVWSMVMLCAVFMIFALFLMQQISLYLDENGLEVDGDLEMMFGSVSVSMLTLYQAATGGDDWNRAYSVITETGAFASGIFILYIAFVQLALINIITGIFVESAMQTLTPDRETVAIEHEQQEKEYAKDLENLCNLVDDDHSGKLTPEQFREGMRKGRIPTLLTLLGLSRHHVLEFFSTMSSLAAHDDGQVNISHFVAGCMKLKGPATNFDLQKLHSHMKSAMDNIDSRLRKFEDERDEAF